MERSMAAAAAALLLPAFVLLCWCVSPAAAQQAQRCTPGDLAALRGFSVGLDAPVSGWPSPSAAAAGDEEEEEDDDCCSWPGVLCSSTISPAAAAIIELSLPNRTLRGPIAASLAGLASLRVLNLSGNALRGPLPPQILLRLRELRSLDLSSNALSGAINLTSILPTSLRAFNVSGNSLTGPHPVLRGATNLTSYDISSNAFSGAISAAALCRESPDLELLRLSMNRLSGEIPAGFSRCAGLAELALDGNGGIHGFLPEDLFGLASLQTLVLHSNSLSGQVPPLLRGLRSLVRIDISFNGFSGELPEAFDAMAGTLQELSAASNLLSGELPATLQLCKKLRVLNLRNNSLSGAMADGLHGLLNGSCGLAYLDLGVNGFSGGIPAGLAGCAGMTALNLGRNALAGEIPSSFAAAGAFPALAFLSLTGNGFSNVTSALMTLQRLPRLTSLVLTKNFHGGGGEKMPMAGIDGFASVEVLVIANCELSGEIPPWLTRLRKLKVLDLSWNRLAGTIPPWLGEFQRLFYLDVSNNSLHGEIPGTIASMPGLLLAAGAGEDDHDAVQDFPFFIRRNSSPAAKGRQYNQVSSFPPSLVLARNGLTGGIPPAMGALTGVHIVDLSWNALSGPIPPELAGMTSLESFDASRNDLSGPIPASLTRLSFLSHFAVAFNRLSGEVPRGGQFSTFERTDFEGNPLLCGRHVGRRCDRDPPPQGDVDGSEGRRSTNIGVVAAICVGTAMLVAVGVVVTWRVWAKRRQDDNAKVAADNDNDVDPEAARLSKMVLLFPDDDDEADGDVKGTTTAMTVEEVVKATGNFAESRIVGCGGFGMVYRATLADGGDVAVKRLSGDTWQAEREFQAEVDALSRVSRHRNLVSLRGYCRHVDVGGEYRLLIYPYMENGSLDHWLHERGGGELPWPTRMRIAIGAARGLAHLHDGPGRTRVLHRDVKSSNILLDGAMEARLGDFGLSRLARAHDDTHVTTDLVGTLGYIPPEYGHSAVATCRGDVYSMGVVLVELVTGRRPVDMAAGARKGGRDVTSWAVRMRREGHGDLVVDLDIAKVERHRQEATRVLDVACVCVREDPKARPTAQQVADWLDAIAAATDSSSSSSSSGSSSDT